MDRVAIKNAAKQQLGGNIFSNKWMMALLVCFLVSIISGVAGSIPAVGAIIVYVLVGPLQFGMSYVFLKLARTNEDIKIEDAFEGFKTDFSGVVVLGLMEVILTLLWSLLFIIPGIIKGYAYSMAFYVKADHPEYKWNECLSESQRIMNGHKLDLFILQLSFIGWEIVGMCACCIGLLWVEPYMQAAVANFYESIKDYNHVETN